jgi:toxin YoeB
MDKLWLDGAWKEYVEWLKKDKRVLKRINEVIKSIDRNGYNCIGKPEALSGDLAGWWSVRLNQKDRLIFKISDNQIIILQCGTHYSDH